MIRWLACPGEQPLDLADSCQRVLGPVPMPSQDRSLERLLQAVPLMQCEGVAPAIFHLSLRDIGLCETIASMRNRAFDEIYNLIEARSAQLGA